MDVLLVNCLLMWQEEIVLISIEALLHVNLLASLDVDTLCGAVDALAREVVEEVGRGLGVYDCFDA